MPCILLYPELLRLQPWRRLQLEPTPLLFPLPLPRGLPVEDDLRAVQLQQRVELHALLQHALPHDVLQILHVERQLVPQPLQAAGAVLEQPPHVPAKLLAVVAPK
eukprot:CAMPEP_0174895730 /NCGR_PEP_ID=MMETSP0167-20121228/10069_1 /TAXON_ID=38298 /ORGANISM="Rhodella maculata, Strain CCMP736" /LENGTH=104 /DNA_ID=CAMNT_0016135129 /DNA_START=525 /DNA_END=836 /DNA_ORIENTATION=+